MRGCAGWAPQRQRSWGCVSIRYSEAGRKCRLLIFTGVPEPALSSLRATGLSLAFIDSLEGTLDPTSIVILHLCVGKEWLYLHYLLSSLHGLLPCLQKPSLVTVTEWPIVLTPPLCASELALARAAVRRAMLLAVVGMLARRRNHRHYAEGKLKTMRLGAQRIQILP